MGQNSNRKARINIYPHEIDLAPLQIRNLPREEFRKTLGQIKYRGYEVEYIADGRRIVITKPGGKFTFGTIKRDDFMVWVFNPENNTLWLISHKNIIEDLEEKGAKNPAETIRIIEALHRVLNGEEPDDILKATAFENPCGQHPEILMKAYKWIWGQEDCNYPPPLKGRDMSMEAIKKLQERLEQLLGNRYRALHK